MIPRISTFLHRQTTATNITLLALVDLAFNLTILPRVMQTLDGLSGGRRPLDLLFHYTPEQAAAVMAAFTKQGRNLYCLFALTGDLLYPFCYSCLLALLITATLRRANVRGRATLLNTVPLGALVFDLLENLCLAVMAWRFPWWSDTLARLAALCTSLKWIFVGASILILLAGLFYILCAKRSDS